MPAISLSTRLEFPNLAAGQRKNHLLVRLDAQKQGSEDRQPVAIAAVIDCSTSMAGEKLDYAKKTLKTLIRHMGPMDLLSISAFSDTIKTVIPMTRMAVGEKEVATREVDRLHVIGSTNLSGAVLEGWARIKDTASPISRVILFTDGQPTAGITSPESIIKMSLKPQTGLASLTTMGYGLDVNKELLAGMASAGGGNYYTIESPESCLSVFGAELGGLLSCVSQNIKVRLDVPQGVRITRLLNEFNHTKNESWAEVLIGDAYAEEARKLLFELDVDPVEGRLYTMGVKTTFYDVRASENRFEEAFSGIAIVPAEKASPQDQEVKEQIAIQEAARAQEEARKRADQGDFQGAQHFVMAAMASLKGVGTVTADVYAKDLKDNVMTALCDAQSYQAAGGGHYLHSNKAGFSKGRASNKSLSKSIGTQAQKDVTESFEEDGKKA